jgi:4-amino-4-deoxy-L-arabinose transferase-like glycosyltransferase
MRPAARGPHAPSRFACRCGLVAVLVYAAAVRLALLDVPFHGTAEATGTFQAIEARNYVRLPWAVHHGIPVQSMGDDPAVPVTFYPNHPPLVPLSIALAYRTLGEGNWQTRLPPALATIGTLVALYLVLAGLGRRQAGVIAAALYAATPMVLYYGGQPEFPNTQFTLLCLLTFAAFLRFHRRPGAATLSLVSAAFALAATADWPAFHIVPVVGAYFLATRPRRAWGWAALFGLVAVATFAGLYAHVVRAATGDWAWMAEHLRTRAGGGDFTAGQWLAAAWRFNADQLTVPVLLLAAAWIGVRLLAARRRRAAAAPDRAATLAWLVLAWAALHVAVGRQGCFQHPWWWWPATLGVVLAAALALDAALAVAGAWARRPRAAATLLAMAVGAFAVTTTRTTVPRLVDPRLTGEGEYFSGPLLAAAARAAAPDRNSAVLLVTDDRLPNLWFYADRPLKTNVWDVASFEARLGDGIADLPFGFRQRWPAAPVALVFPEAYRGIARELDAYLRARYRAIPAPPELGALYRLYDLTRPAR